VRIATNAKARIYHAVAKSGTANALPRSTETRLFPMSEIAIFHSDESSVPEALPARGWYIGVPDGDGLVREDRAIGPYASRSEAVEACELIEYGEKSPEKHRVAYRAHCQLLRSQGRKPAPYLIWLRVQIGSENEFTGRALSSSAKQNPTSPSVSTR
jgi:hypothetical protein